MGAASLLLGSAVLVASLALAASRATALVGLARNLAWSPAGLAMLVGALAVHLGLVMTHGGNFLGLADLHFAYPGGVRCGPPTGGC